MSQPTCSKKYPPVPRDYICKACDTKNSHWIMACSKLEEYEYLNSKYAVNYDHIKMPVSEFTDSIVIDDDDEKYTANELLNIFDKLSIRNDQLSLWAGYGEESELFSSKQDARDRLKSVIDFVETNRSCSKYIKHKLRLITKVMIDKGGNEYIHILLLLASHGRVCNVMKEVAINNSYCMMTDKLSEFIQSQSLQQQIIRVLRDYRELLVEVLFHQFGMTNNTHYIAAFHNVLADKIGVLPYNDDNICSPSSSKCKDWRKNIDKRYFKTLYTKKNIINHILGQIYEKKIGYQQVVQYFQDHCPKTVDRMTFLKKAIDIDTGKINKEYICWLLEKLNIFMIKTNHWKPIEKCWDDINA